MIGAATSNESPPPSLRILLVEDNAVDARLVREFLKQATRGHGDDVLGQDAIVAHVVRLQEAVDWLSGHDADLILLDLFLPDANGIQAIIRLHALLPSVPIVVMSALKDEAVALAGMQAGAQDYLVKGRIKREMLARSLRYAIARNGDERERVRRTGGLRAREESVRAMVEVAPIGACIIDQHGLLESVNEACAALYGFTREELLGRHSSTFAPDLLQDMVANPSAPGESTAYCDRQELEAVTRQGQRLRMLNRTVPFTGADGQPRYAVFMVDVTVIAQAALEAKHEWAAVEELARLRDDFVDSVSHELRTPLTAILGFTEVLEACWADMDDGLRRNWVHKIALSANRQRKLIEDLLLTRIESNELVDRAELVTPALLAQRSADEVRDSYPGQRIDLSGPHDLHAWADTERTAQILAALIDNAAKYSPEGCPIEVYWQAEAANLAIKVRDHGPGVPELGHVQLFTRFGRVPNSKTRGGHVGLGLGLYLGRRLAHAMNGSLDLESTSPQGSVFCLRLPLAEQ